MLMTIRDNGYMDWVSVLSSPESLKKDAEALCTFAKKNNVIGYKLVSLSPELVSVLFIFSEI